MLTFQQDQWAKLGAPSEPQAAEGFLENKILSLELVGNNAPTQSFSISQGKAHHTKQ